MRRRTHWAFWVMFGFVATGLAIGDTPNDHPVDHEPTNSAVISNGTIKLGVRDEGHLNIAGAGIPSKFVGTTDVGLRLIFPDGSESEATAPGCLCEGWGASADGDSCYATTENVFPSISGISNVVFANPAGDTAISTVTCGTSLIIEHDCHPSLSPNLFECTVTMTNVSGSTVNDLRYRRVMDWDIGPTTFSECVTLNEGTAVDLAVTTTNGFDNPDPTVAPDVSGYSFGPVTDLGPTDHGALFQFEFADVLVDGLDPGESKVFNIYYGAAFNQNDAQVALTTVGAEAFSFGKPHDGARVCSDTPNTFIFGFVGVGGDPVAFEGITLSPAFDVNMLDTEHTVTALVLDELLAPAPGITVDFVILSGPNAGEAGSDVTDANGEATFTWVGDAGVGSDFIQGSFIDPITGELRLSNIVRKRWNDGLLVVLESFTAERTKRGVLIEWSSLVELDTVGYRLIRETAGPAREKRTVVLTPALIPASGSEITGASYRFLDGAKGLRGTVTYWLEDVDTHGRVTRHGPLTVNLGGRTAKR